MRIRALVVLCIAVLSLAPLSPAEAAPQQYDDSIRVDGAVTYAVDLPARTIRVHIDVTLESLEPPRSFAGGIQYAFFSDFPFAVPAGASNIRAVRTSDGAARPIALEPIDDFYGVARLQLSPRLEFGAVQTYSIDYDLIDGGERTATITRVNAAFASWDLIPVGGAGSADITVILPEGLDVEFVGETLEEVDRTDDKDEYHVADIADPQTWFASVSASDEDKLLTRQVDLDDGPVVIRAWPGDDEWADFVADTVTRGVSGIEARVGFARPDADGLAIVESASPYLYGYAGWYVAEDDRIDVGDQLDRQVVLHELSHIWFNHELYDSRWINEGLAELVSNQVMADLGEPTIASVVVDRNGPGAQSLNEWAEPLSTESANEAQEDYGYDASYAVIDQLMGSMTPETFHAVLGAASRRDISYVGSGAPETVSGTPNWRILLDQLENIGAVAAAPAFFEQFVVADADRDLLATRLAARDTYAELVAAADGWSAPFLLRERMALWAFNPVDDMVADARVLLARRGDLAVDLEPIGAAVPDALREAYDQETFSDATKTFDAFDEAAAALVEAEAVADDGGGNPLAMIGLLGNDPNQTYAEAVDDFAAGDADEAEATARSVVRSVDDATLAGALRLAALGGVVVVGVGVRRWLRRRPAKSDASLEPDPEADPDLESDHGAPPVTFEV